ncbi:MAG: oxygen-independent coproporphyrinogen III oxidase [Flavipsychrobacter sp.]
MDDNLYGLLQKYDVPTPRYTSYPTVPYWQFDTLSIDKWKESVVKRYNAERGELSLYIHLPFCEDLCTYCACNKRITKNHRVEDPYIETVLKEWVMYRALLPGTPVIREIHLGGGTPTFFSPANLERLINGLTKDCVIAEGHEFSVEVHPNHTSRQHLETLSRLGFNRISLGVQDFDPTVQFIINRIQTFERTKEVIDWARELGYDSVNIDLIYGLPKQTIDSIIDTIEKVKLLMPDRIAFYSYAHVPWKSKGQRRYTDEDVPVAAEKLKMYTTGNEMLAKIGFVSIGMDHFALPGDKLLTAYKKGALHRNFMGYTTTNNRLLIGLGVSAISDAWDAFAQNEKEVEAYEAKIHAGEWPLVNGHLLSDQDIVIRQHILNLMCRDTTTISEADLGAELYASFRNKAEKLVDDGLLELQDNELHIIKQGKLFIRNICATLDAYLLQVKTTSGMFSKAI